MHLFPPEELEQARAVVGEILRCIETGETIRLPAYDASTPAPPADYALLNVGLEPNRFGAFLGDFRYQFEGEDDLLHLMICRRNGGDLSMIDAQPVVEAILPGVPSGLFWVKSATKSQHFYLGHEAIPAHYQG